MIHFLNRGAIITVADLLHPGEYKHFRNPDWKEMPEIISFTEFLRWNYTLNYGRYIREAHTAGTLPLPYDIPETAGIDNVTITGGAYDRLDQHSFSMHVICDVHFILNGKKHLQQYLVHGIYHSESISDFFLSAELYDIKYIRCRHRLDEYLVPVLGKRQFDQIAEQIMDEYAPDGTGDTSQVDGLFLARAMGYQVQYARLSLNRSAKSKLIPERRTVMVYDRQGEALWLDVKDRTILVDASLKGKDEEQNAVIHECVHAHLHNLFYELQSYYRRIIGRETPEFSDFFYSPAQKKCVYWMETQANTIARHIQMPKDETIDAIIDYLDRIAGEPDWNDYRGLIDCIKSKFGVSRYAAKKRIIELGWKEVRGVYVYNLIRYVDDYDVDERFPADCTYTLTLRHISEIYGECEAFVEAMHSGRFVYLDGHVVLNSDKYISRLNGLPMRLTYYARHHMAECCIDFKRIYGEFSYSYTYGELHKDELKPIKPENRELTAEQRRKLRMALYEIAEESDKLEGTPTVSPFARAVVFHMERCGLTIEQVADRSGLAVNTIGKMRTGKKVKLETVLAFCVALELEETFRVDLMQKADVHFNAKNPAHRMYMTIFDLLPEANVFQINQFLREEGFTPWTQEREQKKGASNQNAAG